MLRFTFAICFLAAHAFAAIYEVGDGHPYASIGSVPWESLQPGDEVRIHARATPYREKWVICRQGSAAQPIRVVGIPTGDYDRNSKVELADYTLWEASLGSSTELGADGNRNGVVDAGDYTLWRDNFPSGGGAGGVEVSAVPEPVAAWFSLFAIVLTARLPRLRAY